MPFRIRAAEAAEVPALQAIELDAARTYGTAPGYGFCCDLPARDEAEHARARRHGAAFVAERDGAPVAFALVVPADGRAHLLELAVASALQRQGCGRALLAAVEDWARERGLPEVTLTTFRDVAWNAPTYRRLGYAEIALGRDRPDLLAIRREERRAGFDRQSRLAMAKRLGAR